MEFKVNTCPNCHSYSRLMSCSENPMARPLCFECLSKIINVHNINDAEKFCRTYNIGFSPQLWIKLAEQIALPSKMIETYAQTVLSQIEGAKTYSDKAAISFQKLNDEWAERTTQIDILNSVSEIKESFIERARINWGAQYSFEELVKLEDLYYQSLKANSITNPIQRESLRTLLKIMIDINKSIELKDTSEVKNLTTAFTQMAKTAQLDNLIDDTHTDDITTLAEIVQIVEDAGFDMPYYDNSDRDGIDFAIKDIEESNARLVKNATGLGPQIEQMVSKYQQEETTKNDEKAKEETPFSDLLSKYREDAPIPTEDDSVITEHNFVTGGTSTQVTGSTSTQVTGSTSTQVASASNGAQPHSDTKTDTKTDEIEKNTTPFKPSFSIPPLPSKKK